MFNGNAEYAFEMNLAGFGPEGEETKHVAVRVLGSEFELTSPPFQMVEELKRLRYDREFAASRDLPFETLNEWQQDLVRLKAEKYRWTADLREVESFDY